MLPLLLHDPLPTLLHHSNRPAVAHTDTGTETAHRHSKKGKREEGGATVGHYPTPNKTLRQRVLLRCTAPTSECS